MAPRLRLAAENGHLEIVELLLLLFDTVAFDSILLNTTAAIGHLGIVKLLLPLSDPKAAESHALNAAAKYGHLEIVRLLLPLSDTAGNGSCALILACESGHLEIVKLLLPVSAVAAALDVINLADSTGRADRGHTPRICHAAHPRRVRHTSLAQTNSNYRAVSCVVNQPVVYLKDAI